ncbi:hypothetical protein [Streptomyces sp. NPDC048473]
MPDDRPASESLLVLHWGPALTSVRYEDPALKDEMLRLRAERFLA